MAIATTAHHFINPPYPVSPGQGEHVGPSQRKARAFLSLFPLISLLLHSYPPVIFTVSYYERLMRCLPHSCTEVLGVAKIVRDAEGWIWIVRFNEKKLYALLLLILSCKTHGKINYPLHRESSGNPIKRKKKENYCSEFFFEKLEVF